MSDQPNAKPADTPPTPAAPGATPDKGAAPAHGAHAKPVLLKVQTAKTNAPEATAQRPGLLARFPNVATVLFAVAVVAFLSTAKALVGVEDTLQALIVQLAHDSKARFENIVIIKKDESTSGLTQQNPGRPEFASLIEFLGQPRRIPATAASPLEPVPGVSRVKLLEIICGFGPSTQSRFRRAEPPLIDSPWLSMLLGPATTTAAVQGLRIKERLDSAREMLDWPATEGASGPLRFTPVQWRAFLTALSKADLQPAVRLTFAPCELNVSWQLLIDTRPDAGVPIPPVAVIVMDFVLQGAKLISEDQMLAAALHTAQSPIILAAMSHVADEQREQGRLKTIERTRIDTASGTVLASRTVDVVLDQQSSQLFAYEAFMAPLVRLGFINIAVGSKNLVTQVPLFSYHPDPVRPGKGALSPSISLVTAAVALDRTISKGGNRYEAAMKAELERILPEVEAGTYRGGFRLFDRTIPTDSRGHMLVNYFGSAQPDRYGNQNFPSFSFYQCYTKKLLDSIRTQIASPAPELSPEVAHRQTLRASWTDDRGIARHGIDQNAICMIGPFELSDMDFYNTPFNVSTPFRTHNEPLMGIEIHANAVLTILGSEFLHAPRYDHAFLLLLAFCALLVTIMERLSPVVGAGAGVGLAATAFAWAYYSRTVTGQLVLVSPFFVALPLVWAGSTLRHYLAQWQRADKTKQMFQRFVSRDVVQHMLEHPELVRPGGQRRDLTVFFSDLSGFTTISEMLSPEDLVTLLNEYLGAMTDILFKYEGTLDKFIGDAVMAFWNYPKPIEDHPLSACLCAIAMQERIKILREDWLKRGFPKVTARVGLNTQDVVVGYMGSEGAQMNFTCMGDGVNLASRLEGANKEYGTLMMMSDRTYQRVKHRIRGRFLDFLAVKGKNEPVLVWEIISEIGKEPPGFLELLELYERGMKLHLDRQWDEAIDCFEQILARWPDDGPSQTYLSRCQQYKEEPPPENWDGSYHLKKK